MLEFGGEGSRGSRVHRTKMMLTRQRINESFRFFCFFFTSKTTYPPPTVPRQTDNAEVGHKDPDRCTGEDGARPGSSLCPRHRH